MSERVEDMSFDEVKSRVDQALQEFENNEQSLLTPLGVERNVVQQFARYLQEQFPNWHVDCEYSQIRKGTSDIARRKVADLYMRRVNSKVINLDTPEERQVIPDIIIHHRRTTENLLAIEVKTANIKEMIKFDKEKLRAYREYEPLSYQYALFLRFQSPNETRSFIAEREYI